MVLEGGGWGEGLMTFLFVFLNFVYGCVVCMCLSGGFCSMDIWSSSIVV